jgi:hypothetical protein
MLLGMTATPRERITIGRRASGQTTRHRLAPAARDAAYRRLAAAIVGLDVLTLAAELRAARPQRPVKRGGRLAMKAA